MKKIAQFILKIIRTRLGFALGLVLLYWLKTMWAYGLDFNLDTKGAFQNTILLLNPIPIALFLIGLALYIKNTKAFYITASTLYIILFIWLYANSIYYREFSDFISISTIMASSSVSAGLGDAALKLFRIWDIAYFADIAVILYFLCNKKRRQQLFLDRQPLDPRTSFAVTAVSVLLFSLNFFLAEVDRPELLSRGFSNTYIVRGLGVNAFFAYSANQTYQAEKDRSEAKPDDLQAVTEYIQAHYAQPNDAYFGIAKGRNIIYIHLESLQQFIIDYKLVHEGQEYEVTPFLNSLYHANSTLAFPNFFHQVKAGKTSDSETLIETSLFGLNQGSYMVTYGGTNTQYAAPSILSQLGHYTSAVFHGNAGSFWNRNNTYKQWGYNYFFDASAFSKQTDKNSFQYGLNDKIMLADSIKYLERMQQPFYAKFITVSNHYPYTSSLIGDEQGFPLAETKDDTINGYFATANYLDSSVEAFFNYLKATGLYEHSIIILYGDHYGISNSRNATLAPLIGKNSETWSAYDNAMLQRVPYMIVIPGMENGGIVETYGGEVDALPTLEHLMGIDSTSYIQVGQDLLSPQHQQIVAMRTAGQFVTPTYTSYNGRTYYTQTGEEITHPDETTKAELKAIRAAAEQQLAISDKVQSGDLLRFYENPILKPVDTSQYSYLQQFKQLKAIEDELGAASTSLYTQRGQVSSQDLFQAPSYRALHPEPTLVPSLEETQLTPEENPEQTLLDHAEVETVEFEPAPPQP